ncbi:hypothetical protein GCM10027615_47130 [Plantactinospora veratri]
MWWSLPEMYQPGVGVCHRILRVAILASEVTETRTDLGSELAVTAGDGVGNRVGQMPVGHRPGAAFQRHPGRHFGKGRHGF